MLGGEGYGGGVIATVTASQMREIDRVMTDELGIDLLQMMENAGRALAEQARRALGGSLRDRDVTVLAGRGGNGGGGLAAARRMAGWGARVSVVLADGRDTLVAATAAQLEILDHLGLAVSADGSAIRGAALLVDALVGYGLRDAPRGRVAELIREANASGIPVLALDIPSGLDPDTGEPREPTIRASWTLTLALPKAGLVVPGAREWVGDLSVADISVPASAYRRLGIAVGPIFDDADIVRVTPP